MASYRNIVNHVFKWEGGLVYHNNEGQWTNMGVQFATFKALAAKLLGNPNPTVEDLKNLTKGQAEKFIEYFWNKATYNNSIHNQAAANLMFQAYWGSGAYGIKRMQQALNDTYRSNLSIDGVVGPATTGVINSQGGASMVLYSALEDFYKDLGKKPVYARYLKGWLNRLRELYPSGMLSTVGLIGILTLLVILT